MDVWRPLELSTAVPAGTDVVIDVAVGGGSTEPFALSFKGWDTTGRSVVDSITADNLGGALKNRTEQKYMTKEGLGITANKMDDIIQTLTTYKLYSDRYLLSTYLLVICGSQLYLQRFFSQSRHQVGGQIE